MSARQRTGRRSTGKPSGRAREWIGGLLSPPIFIEDRAEPYRADLAIWMELPSGLVVGQQVLTPERVPGAVGQLLRESIERPLTGPPRRPQRIRVADDALAAEVRQALGDAIPIEVAPTPELDELLAHMLETLPGAREDVGYLDSGRVPPETVEKLFAAARVLFAVKPWQRATDDQVLRMDIPALGVEGACVSIIGNLGESLGVLVFPSLAGYEAFLEAAGAPPRRSGPEDLGTAWISLSFERGADLPDAVRREISVHNWPVASADAYPYLTHRDRDATPRPLVPRDFAVATACAASISAFFLKHPRVFETDDPEPISESWFDRDDLEVRFTMPYEAYPLFVVGGENAAAGGLSASAPPPSVRTGPRVGRNDPCPCGSGRKYKKCCLRRDEEQQRASHSLSERDAGHELDNHLVGAMLDFAERRFGRAWLGFEADFVDPKGTLELTIPWAVYGHRVDGATVCEHFLEAKRGKLSARERSWLDAQRDAWLTVWEVTSVEPGVQIGLRDLLSGETRVVREGMASTTLVLRDAVLGRVVDFEGRSLLCGMYPRPLPPFEAAEVVDRARTRLRRRRLVPVERLRAEAIGRLLIRCWEEFVEDLEAESAIPRVLQNTDGDPLLVTTDHFAIAPGQESAVAACLADLPGVEPPAREEGAPAYVFLRAGNPMHASWENTVVGRAVLDGSALRLETNSRERADALRAQVEAACSDRIRHRAREHADPLSERAALARPAPAAEPLPVEEADEMIRAFKERHYADWADQPLPALGGDTPRQAVRTAEGRSAVDVLLKDMENREQRSSPGVAFDFGPIRRALRLD